MKNLIKKIEDALTLFKETQHHLNREQDRMSELRRLSYGAKVEFTKNQEHLETLEEGIDTLQASLDTLQKYQGSDFGILHQMTQAENGNDIIFMTHTFVDAQYSSQGTKITMGMGGNVIHDMMDNKKFAVLYLVDREEFFSRKKSK